VPLLPTIRRALGILHLAAGVFLLVALAYQIVDLAIHDALVPHEYFTYFTIQSTIIDVVLLLLTGIGMLRTRADGVLLTSAALAIVPYAVVTGVVYNLTLRGLPSEKYLGDPWPNEVMHVVVPVLLVVDWFVLRLLDPGRPRLPWRTIWLALAFPAVWVIGTMLRGAATGWYPYPFLVPSGPGGIPGIVAYVVGICVAIVVITAFGILVTRAQVWQRGHQVTTRS
jgi:hypothetical protein